MTKRVINWSGAALGALFFAPLPLALAAPSSVAPVDFLLEQVLAGEATNKYDLVQQSLYRLEKIDPDNPQVIAARLRMALRQGDRATAETLLTALRRVAPDSAAMREAQAGMLLSSPEGRQKLQEARLLATSGRLVEARAAWDALFHGTFPDVNVALEYWRLVLRLPGQETRALTELEALDRRYPGNVGVRLQIARAQFAQNNAVGAQEKIRQLAGNAAGRNAAAELWLQNIQAQPVTAESITALKQYLDLFTTGDAQKQGQAELAKRQQQLADPAFQQRSRALALVERGGNAIPALEAALRSNPDDADLLGAMGQAQARNNQRAVAIRWLEKAIAAGPDSTQIGKWQSLVQTNRYWLAIENGDKALAAGDVNGAQTYYQQAQLLDKSDSYALIGLGDVAATRQQNDAAEQAWKRALRLDATNTTAIRRLVAYYQQQSPQRALAFINQLPPDQQRALAGNLTTLRSEIVRAEADALAERGAWPQAVEKYRQAQQDAPDDVWLNYRLAGALRQSGQPQQADEQIANMSRQRLGDATQVYASALWFSGSGRTAAALATLNSLPQVAWNQDIRDLATRLQQDQIYQHADALRNSGREPQAEALLRQLPSSPRRDLTLADWALERGDAARALASYQQVLDRDTTNSDAQLGRIEALIALNQQDKARRALQGLPPVPVEPNLNRERRIANAWQRVGEPDRAAAHFTQGKMLAQRQPPSQSSALLFRDAARFAAQQQQPQQALADYRQAMVASGITTEEPKDNVHFTQLMRTTEGDDWLKRSIRRDAADRYQQQQTTLTLAEDYSRNKGTPGISDFTAHTTMLQAETPLAAGNVFVRFDHVAVSAGTFAGSHSENFGSCADANSGVCDRDFNQQAEGVALGAGWNNDRWSADIGTTPLGFQVVNWVGGASWQTDAGPFGLTFGASRRPISSSLLAYAGARDPSANGGKTWGGVVASGGNISISYDRGEANGVWADLSAHQLSGENVTDNSRQRLMGGYYYKWVNEDNRRATIGLNSMLWHYQKDLSDYAFGQGGYYSPQQYFSLSLPLSWRQRTTNWSVDIGGALSWSRSHSASQTRYPVNPGFTPASNPASTASSSSGFGYTLQAAIERRLTAHWTLGASVDIQQAKDYTPSHGLLYIRYTLAGWEGDLNIPPQPLTPYANFK